MSMCNAEDLSWYCRTNLPGIKSHLHLDLEMFVWEVLARKQQILGDWEASAFQSPLCLNNLNKYKFWGKNLQDPSQ